jgi:hypothetical protein
LSLGLSGVVFDGWVTPAWVMQADENSKIAQIKETTIKDQICLETAQALQSLIKL